MLDRTRQPQIRTLEHFTVPRPRRVELSGGVPLYILPMDGCEVVRLDLVFGGGRWQQHQLLQALFTNRMLREGTRQMRGSDLSERLDFYGGWLDVSVSYCHSFLTLYSLNKYLPQTIALVEDMVKQPVFPQDELEVVRQTNLQRYLVNRVKTKYQAQLLLFQSLFGNQYPAAILAGESDYAQIGREALLSFHARHYQSQNCSIYLSGQVGDSEIRCVERAFGQPFGRQLGAAQPVRYDWHPAGTVRAFHEMPDAPQSSVCMGMPVIDRHHPDFLKLSVVVTLLGGYFGSRLVSNIREEKGYTYGIGAHFAPYPEVNTLLISADCAPQYVNPLIDEVHAEVERLQSELVGDEELDRVRNYMMGDYCRNFDGVLSLADAWILAHTEQFPDNYHESAIHAMRSITAHEVRELARKYLCREQVKEAVAGQRIC